MVEITQAVSNHCFLLRRGHALDKTKPNIIKRSALFYQILVWEN